MRNVLGASTAALCLGGLLAACGGGDGDGYVATGPAAAGPERAAGKGVAPTGDVELIPLDGESSSGEGGDGRRDGSESPDSGSGESSGKSTESKGGSGSSATPGSDDSSTDGAKPGRTESGSGGGGSAGRPEDAGASGSPSGSPSAPGGSSGPSGPSGPAKLSVGEPERKPAADRWCEKVTVSFRNTGGAPVRSGTVTFETHVIGALGVDWATIESTEKLPALDAGQQLEKTWPVCVDPWRVPLGMHIETQDVSVKWK